jgi:lipopolysaccharide/colanic/teichoic acid biosynthesis glycosyltransferase
MNTRKLEIWILLADLASVVGAFFGADLLRFGPSWTPDERASIHALLPFVIVTCVLWIALSSFMPMDGFRGGWKLSAVFSNLLLGSGCVFGVLLALGYLMRTYVSRLALGYFLFLLIGGFLAVRCLARLLLRWRHQGGDVWRVVILGSGRVAQQVAAKIDQHPEMLCRVVGMLFPNQDGEEMMVPGLEPENPLQISTLGIFDLLRREKVDEVIIALSQPLTPEIRTLINRIRNMGVETALVPQSYELYASQPRLVSVDHLPLLQLRDPDLRRRYVVLKRWMDIAIALPLLIPAWLFLLPFGLILKLRGGKSFRTETRCGQYGQPFQMLRLNLDRPVQSNSAFEFFVDHMSITELPQLWNVLRGQMSLVGPRPDPLVRSSQYSDWQQRRLKVKPGMTGLAQVHGLREFSSAEQKTRFDLEYALNPYLLWDVALLLQTIWTIFLRIWSRPRRGVFDVNFKSEPVREMLSDANRTQPRAD